LFVVKHEHVLNAILENAASPLNLEKEELILKTPSDLKGKPPIVGRHVIIDGQVSLDEALNSGLWENV
jgi:hypothetical protein